MIVLKRGMNIVLERSMIIVIPVREDMRSVTVTNTITTEGIKENSVIVVTDPTKEKQPLN
ncbi:hypothetical protein GCM10007971_12920 [Oceanobacillus indicireducens]|uniref:Uncharacterized protein n=2 Tax=Oceanobacillus indicireducens TaxID=1004261 RepID=A0A917XWL8_9BACI|nr:hypothetical protein GCM10007971_12920 [Oceanobacillus indicireducens]